MRKQRLLADGMVMSDELLGAYFTARHQPEATLQHALSAASL
ncbi:hypothetical protein pCS0038 (plasmid) [Clavibacter sepedonicus]|uniref:Uncharacterized protein n=1 Tax=Clavibacter sepedonicus TaxID=31964 RepID=B0RJ32_CLASE|nr:hypothetical protein pCS0038 [Clavibacter sepedonicus]